MLAIALLSFEEIPSLEYRRVSKVKTYAAQAQGEDVFAKMLAKEVVLWVVECTLALLD